jgi:hypothetical protein
LSGIQGQLRRRDKSIQLQNHLAQQHSLFKSSSLQSDTSVSASYVISEFVEKMVKHCSDGEIKECMKLVADVAFKKTPHFKTHFIMFHH